MKKLLLSTTITALTILMFAFGDSSQSSFSQRVTNPVPVTVMPQAQAKSLAVKNKEIILKSVMDSIEMTKDSLRFQLNKTDSIKQVSIENLDNQLINKDKLQNLQKEAKKTLIIAKQQEKKMPMMFITHPRKSIEEIPVNIKPKDTIVEVVEKRSLWNRMFHKNKKK